MRGGPPTGPTPPGRCKQERSDGYLLAHGGVRFARSLVETGLIDEYRLVTHPVLLGAGERIFMAPLTIEPMSTIALSGGAVAHVFAAHLTRQQDDPGEDQQNADDSRDRDGLGQDRH